MARIREPHKCRADKSLTQARLKELVHYDPVTGWFTRLHDSAPCGRWKSGTRLGSTKSTGYREIAMEGWRHLEHRLAFLYMTGTFPDKPVDHKNHANRSDNSWANLRLATHTQNLYNSKAIQKSSVYKGVAWDPVRRKWHARIRYANKQHSLGFRDSEVEAHGLYCEAAKKIAGEFASFG